MTKKLPVFGVIASGLLFAVSALAQGSGPCTVKTDSGEVTLSDGANIEIKDGKITIK